jgi:S1-C subfamily serine protease
LRQVKEGGTAARAGLRPDDVVVAVEGQEVAAAYLTPSIITFLKPITGGQPVSERVKRAGGVEEITVAA